MLLHDPRTTLRTDLRLNYNFKKYAIISHFMLHPDITSFISIISLLDEINSHTGFPVSFYSLPKWHQVGVEMVEEKKEKL